MNVTTVTTGTSTSTLNQKTYKIEMMDDGNLSIASDDDDDDLISTDEGSLYGDGELVQLAVQDDVANQLAAAGPVGVAAAAAIASSKKRKRPHCFETNPSVRKRQQNRLLRKLRDIINEFTGRVGKQAVVLVATPGKPNTSYKVFGAKPLEDVVKNLKNIVMDELENALAQQAPPPAQEDPSLFELPPLIIDGIPTPVEKMTQAQLRAFIPLMLKYSTGRGKPGWGRESTRPPWWPKELPWANVRMDARSEDDKQKISWTHALRKIVINCYKYHGREDLLPTFADDDDKVNALIAQAGGEESMDDEDEDMEDDSNNTVQTLNHSNNSNNNNNNNNSSSTNTTTYTQTVLSTIQNADGTVSLIQVDPNNPIITLPDGTTAQVQGVATLHQGEGGATIQTVQSLSDGSSSDNMTVDLTEAAVSQDGQIYITSEDGQGYPVSVGNMITVPVSASMYQSMMANIQQIHTNSDGTVCITPMKVDSQNNNNNLNPNQNHNNNCNEQQQQYPCYSLMAATPSLAQRLLLNNQINISNNNNNNNAINNLNIVNNSLKRHLINTTTPVNNSSQNSIQKDQQQQQQHILPAGAKIFVASSNLHTNTVNVNNNNINNNNNNNNNNNHNVKKFATALMSLPIVVAPLAQFKTSPSKLNQNKVVKTTTTTKSDTPKTSRRNLTGKKRRLNLGNKNLPIKLEQVANVKNNDTTTNSANEKQRQQQTNNDNLLPMKAIKLETMD